MIFEAKMQGWKSKMILFHCVQTKLRHISIAASWVCLLCTHIRLAKCLIRLHLNPLLLLYNYCCNWWQLLRVYTISILENVGFPFVLFRFIMYIAEFFICSLFLFSSLLSLCVCLNNEKIHKIVQVWVCVSAAAARQRQFRFTVESLPALFSHSTNPKRNENQKYCHWFCLIGSCIGLVRCYRKVIASTFHLWRISFFSFARVLVLLVCFVQDDFFTKCTDTLLTRWLDRSCFVQFVLVSP